jgi:hypothetical protein
MSDTVAYGARSTEWGASTCACAPVASSTSPAAKDPVNNFITQCSCKPRRLRA